MVSTDNIILSTQCSTINRRCYVVQHISRTYSSRIIEYSLFVEHPIFPFPESLETIILFSFL